MLRPLRSEIYRLRHRWMPWMVLGVIVVLGFLMYELIYTTLNAQIQLIKGGNAPASVTQGDPAATLKTLEQTVAMVRPGNISDFGVSLVAGLGSVMLIVFTASHVGTEFTWGTLRTVLASGIGRAEFLVAKLVSILLFAIVFAIVGIAAVVAASFLVSTQAGFDTSGFDGAAVLSSSWRTLYAFLPYIALTSVIVVWIRSTGAGVAAGLVIYFAESLIAQLLIQFNRDFATIANLGIARNVQALSRATVRVGVNTGPSPSGAPALPDQTQAAIVLAVWTAIFIALAFWRLRTRDVTLS
jgi:ABC-2 type transport system permease protein